MDLPKLEALAVNVFIDLAALFFLLAFVDKALNLIGQQLPVFDVWPKQLLTWGVMSLIFASTLLLKQIRDKTA